MRSLLALFRSGWKALKRACTGEILRSIDTEALGGPGIVTLKLKRERRSGDQYVVMVLLWSGGIWYYVFELEEFARFVATADLLRAAAPGYGSVSDDKPTIWDSAKMVLTGEVIQQIDTSTQGGLVTVSLRRKRKAGSQSEYVVLAVIAPGIEQHVPFDLNEFGRLARAARDIYDSAQSSQPEARGHRVGRSGA
jgi:hypothetical protein